MLKLHILFLVRCWYRSSTFKNSRPPTGPLIPTSGLAARAEKKISESWEICRCWTDAEQNISQVDAKNDFLIPNLFTKFPIRSEDQCVRCLGCQSWNMMEYVGINGTRATAGDEMCPGIKLSNWMTQPLEFFGYALNYLDSSIPSFLKNNTTLEWAHIFITLQVDDFRALQNASFWWVHCFPMFDMETGWAAQHSWPISVCWSGFSWRRRQVTFGGNIRKLSRACS